MVINSASMLTAETIRNIISQIPDPEIPVITISDLGILRDVAIKDDKVLISITPTYSGCPALEAIANDIKDKLAGNGITNVEIKTIHFPVWTTDWISDDAKARLKEYGISPPALLRTGDNKIICPRCNSVDVQLVSQFGSTACKALYKCNTCLEPFDHFKCH